MATGTGKTRRTIIGLIYRFLKAERFNRILFLVDRTALGQQALDLFNDAPLEQNQTLSKIYNVAELGDMAFAANGGARQLDRLLGERLSEVLEHLADGLWSEAG